MAADRLTVGVLSPLLTGTYFGEVLKGISSFVTARGGRVLAFQTLDAALGDHYLGPSLFTTRVGWDLVDGFIVITRAAPDDYLRELRERGKPLVMISHHVEGLDCPEVRPDNRAGMADAVSHLVGHGHTRVAFVGDLGNDDAAERYEGYRQGLIRHSIEVPPELVFTAPNMLEEGGYQAGLKLLEHGAPCTAVVTANDQTAAGLLQAVHEAGLRAPSDLAVIGFDDVDIASQLAPPLASVRQNFDLVSATAADLLVQMARGGTVPLGEHRAPGALVPRESCGCRQQFDLHPVGATEKGSGRRDLAQVLAASLARNAPVAGRAPTARAVARLADTFDTAIGSPEVAAALLAGPAEALFRLHPRPETLPAVMEAVSLYRRSLLEESFSPERLSTLDQCAGEVLMALYRAQVRSLAESNERLQHSLRDEYFVSMGLVGLRVGPDGTHAEGAHARSLEWARGTQARAACLATWTGQGPQAEGPAARRLRVVGRYGPNTAGALAEGAEVEVGRFPPVDALEAGDVGAADVVYVLPVRTPTHDWGMLAVAGPPETAARTGRDVYFRWAALVGVALDHEALVESLEAQRRDLADAYRREQELTAEVRASEERYALAASAANDGLWDWDAQRGDVFYSSRWKALLGFSEAEIGDSPSEWLERCHPDDQPALRRLLDAALEGRRQGPWSLEHRLVCRDGAARWFMCRGQAVRVGDGPATRLVGSLTDITERRELEERLRHAALYDGLTGLPNRYLFVDRLSQAVARSKRVPGHRFAVLFLDLDGFKSVNDTYGHVLGDLLLVEVSKRIAAHLRDHDTPVRFGGDEFAVLLDGVTGPDHVEAVAGRLETALSAPYAIEGHQVVVTATVGTAMALEGGDDPDRIIREADDAMYRVKAVRARSTEPLGGGTATPVPPGRPPEAARPGPPGPTLSTSGPTVR